MIQGSILSSFIHRKMSATAGIRIAGDKTCLEVPPIFTRGKTTVEKGSTFKLVTEDKLVLFENLATVEWHPDLYKFSSGGFVGTPVVGPGQELQSLRGQFTATKDFNIRDLPWIARIWLHSR